MRGFVGDSFQQELHYVHCWPQPRMNILVLAGDIPATSNMPGSPRLFSLCRGLSQRHRLTLVAFSPRRERYQAFLDDPVTPGIFEEIEILPKPPFPNWRRRQIHRLRQAPYFVTRHSSPEYHAEQCQRIRNIFVQGMFDVIYVDGQSMAQYVMDSNLECPAIIDLHDSLTLLYSRMMRAEQGWLRRLAHFAEMQSIGRWEKSLSRWFGAIITNSKVDEAFLSSLDSSGNIASRRR